MERIRLADIFQEEGKVNKIELSPVPEDLYGESGQGAEAGAADLGDLCAVTGIEKLLLTIENDGKGRALILGKMIVRLELPCDRCLKPVKKELAIDIERKVVAPELLENDPDQADDQKFVAGNILNPEELLQEELVMNIPAKILCKEDCKGICRVCGQDLNEGECGCDTFVPDPRMAAIADLFK